MATLNKNTMWENTQQITDIYTYILNLFLRRIGSSSVSSCRTRVCRTVNKTNINTKYICFCTILSFDSISQNNSWTYMAKVIQAITINKNPKEAIEIEIQINFALFSISALFLFSIFLVW